MKRTLTVMTMVIALAMSTMAGAFADGHFADKATGTVEFITGGAESNNSSAITTASFDAHAAVEMANGKTRDAKGQVDVINHDGVDFQGTVTAFTSLGEDEARFCGRIDQFDGENIAPNDQGTTGFVIWVMDDGTPGADGDMIAINRRTNVPSCDGETFGPPGRPALSGNLVVHN